MQVGAMDRPSRETQETLVEQLLWLIQLRWLGVIGVVAAALIGNYVFPVLVSPVPLYVCAAVLLLCNIFFYMVTTRKSNGAESKGIVLGMVQVEADIVILSMVLYFSG